MSVCKLLAECTSLTTSNRESRAVVTRSPQGLVGSREWTAGAATDPVGVQSGVSREKRGAGEKWAKAHLSVPKWCPRRTCLNLQVTILDKQFYPACLAKKNHDCASERACPLVV